MANMSMTPKRSSKGLPNHLDKIKGEAREKKRNMFYLILAYLNDNMLQLTADCLIKEAQLDNTYQVCENVELDIILQEYQSFYYTKFQKHPKIIRKLDETEQRVNNSAKRGKSAKKAIATPSPPKDKNDSPSESDIDFQFEIISLNSSSNASDTKVKEKSLKCKPFLPELENYSADNKELINQVSSQVITQNLDVKWSDCLGLEKAIEILKESSIYPMRYPELFKDLVPWKGVLLHGPPGTGKTMLAKALASEGQTTFFNVTSSTFISKWRGESEKMIKFLFDLAKLHAPSTIFFDEIDALVSGIKDTQHEATKRFKSELLIQLDGISTTDGQICVLASTNSPWDLDTALLRRFDKRVLVDMPTKEARIQMLKYYLRHTDNEISVQRLEELGPLTDNYSGSDIKCLCKEVTMTVVRENIKALQKGIKNGPNKKITLDDIKQALEKITPATSRSVCKKYYQWQNEHGAV